MFSKVSLSNVSFYNGRKAMAQGPFKLVGGIAKGHPNDQDLEDAVEFYKGIIRRFDTVIG